MWSAGLRSACTWRAWSGCGRTGRARWSSSAASPSLVSRTVQLRQLHSVALRMAANGQVRKRKRVGGVRGEARPGGHAAVRHGWTATRHHPRALAARARTPRAAGATGTQGCAALRSWWMAQGEWMGVGAPSSRRRWSEHAAAGRRSGVAGVKAEQAAARHSSERSAIELLRVQAEKGLRPEMASGLWQIAPGYRATNSRSRAHNHSGV